MKILAVDIGGTNSRFAHFEGEQAAMASLSNTYVVPTQSVQSFSALLENYEQTIEMPFLSLEEYDVLVFSVAGPVIGQVCRPPNIEWVVDISGLPYRNCFLVNDFVAQSYACLIDEIRENFLVINTGVEQPAGNMAIVGAGTGLGHCCIVKRNIGNSIGEKYTSVASEGGHAQFPLSGEFELAFEEFLKSRLGIVYAYGDAVVSGHGLSLLHEYLGNGAMPPEEVAKTFNGDSETLKHFARFYARACRNYCLAVFATGGLIISGGIAAKNPAIVKHEVFVNEFILSSTHEQLLRDVPIFLNSNEEIGLLGAVYYGILKAD